MPLKHHTETFLVFTLGVVILLTGFLLSTLPSLPVGVVPALLLFVLSVVYPVSLTSFFRRHRADHVFRWLHWFPACMVLVWCALQSVHLFFPKLSAVSSLYTWGWMLPFSTLGILGLVLFCLSVLRRRVPRIGLLLLAFVPFAALAATNVLRGTAWEQEVTAHVWNHPVWQQLAFSTLDTRTGSTLVAREEKQSEKTEKKNLEESEDPKEEEWRERLRAFEKRRQRIEARLTDQDPGDLGPQESPIGQETGTGREYREIVTTPTHLPSSGAATGSVGLSMIAGYCGLLHQRARKRV